VEHVHKDLIIAWANGADIEFYDGSIWKWVDSPSSPSWYPTTQYRIKPTPPADIVCLCRATKDRWTTSLMGVACVEDANFKLIFDRETLALKAVELC
jgi:hypothetical protein